MSGNLKASEFQVDVSVTGIDRKFQDLRDETAEGFSKSEEKLNLLVELIESMIHSNNTNDRRVASSLSEIVKTINKHDQKTSEKSDSLASMVSRKIENLQQTYNHSTEENREMNRESTNALLAACEAIAETLTLSLESHVKANESFNSTANSSSTNRSIKPDFRSSFREVNSKGFSKNFDKSSSLGAASFYSAEDDGSFGPRRDVVVLGNSSSHEAGLSIEDKEALDAMMLSQESSSRKHASSSSSVAGSANERPTTAKPVLKRRSGSMDLTTGTAAEKFIEQLRISNSSITHGKPAGLFKQVNSRAFSSLEDSSEA